MLLPLPGDGSRFTTFRRSATADAPPAQARLAVSLLLAAAGRLLARHTRLATRAGNLMAAAGDLAARRDAHNREVVERRRRQLEARAPVAEGAGVSWRVRRRRRCAVLAVDTLAGLVVALALPVPIPAHWGWPGVGLEMLLAAGVAGSVAAGLYAYGEVLGSLARNARDARWARATNHCGDSPDLRGDAGTPLFLLAATVLFGAMLTALVANLLTQVSLIDGVAVDAVTAALGGLFALGGTLLTAVTHYHSPGGLTKSYEHAVERSERLQAAVDRRRDRAARLMSRSNAAGRRFQVLVERVRHEANARLIGPDQAASLSRLELRLPAIVWFDVPGATADPASPGATAATLEPGGSGPGQPERRGELRLDDPGPRQDGPEPRLDGKGVRP